MRMRFLQVFAIMMALSLAMWAQDTSKTTPSSSDQSAPSAQAPATQSTPSSDQSTAGSASTMPQSDKGEKGMKGEKTLKGCVRSEGGQFFLEGKNGKKASIQSSEDLTAHVGHEVKLHGMWAAASASAGAGASSNLPASDTANAEHAGQTFQVSKVDMVSESCGKSSKSETKSDSTKGDTTKSDTNAPQKY